MPDITKFFYALAYRVGKPRWDSGLVPPEVVALAQNNHARTALDLGCGTGTSAVYLAQRGLSVVGVDFAPRAIAEAREKARKAGVRIDWHVGDVTRLDFLRAPFDLLLDVGCFHGLDAAGRMRYVQEMARLSHPNSVFLMWGFDGPAFFGRYGLTTDHVRRLFEPNWAVTRFERGAIPSQRAGAWYWLVRKSA